MPIPPHDLICRFIAPIHWSKRENGPREGAFKPDLPEQPNVIVGLSVWHQNQLATRDVPIEELLIDTLAGFGRVDFRVQEYSDFARQASQAPSGPFAVRVVLRPWDIYVDPPWRPWNYAHCQVESIRGPCRFTGRFRKLLAANAKGRAIPPN